MKQTEEDADKEILELKTKYEKLLRSEREANVRMRGEGGIVKKKLQTLVTRYNRLSYKCFYTILNIFCHRSRIGLDPLLDTVIG